MKTLLLTLALALSSQIASAAPSSSEPACNKFALGIAQAAFDGFDIKVKSANVVASIGDGAMGEHINIKIVVEGDVTGSLLVTTAGEGDSQDCNLLGLNLRARVQ